MTIHQGSRYRFYPMQQIEDVDGNTHNTHKIRQTSLAATQGFRLYTTKAGDTFEKLAAQEYSDARKWYIIADANPDVFFPLDLGVGVQIVIPNRTFAVLS